MDRCNEAMITTGCNLGIPLAFHSHKFPSINLRAGTAMFSTRRVPAPCSVRQTQYLVRLDC